MEPILPVSVEFEYLTHPSGASRTELRIMYQSATLPHLKPHDIVGGQVLEERMGSAHAALRRIGLWVRLDPDCDLARVGLRAFRGGASVIVAHRRNVEGRFIAGVSNL